MTQPVNKAEVPPTPIIDWSKSPEWAEAAVMASNGCWLWIENKDSFVGGHGLWQHVGKSVLISGVGVATDTRNFRKSKVLRPVVVSQPKPDWSKAPDTATHYDTLRNWFINVDEDTNMVSICQDGAWYPRGWLTGDDVAKQPKRFIPLPDAYHHATVAPASDAERDQQLIDTLADGCADLGIAFDPSKVKIISGLPASLQNFFPDADTALSVSLPLTGDYGSLADVLSRAYDQAASGKGAERHGQAKPFYDQPMQKLIDLYGVGFALGQAGKKAQESMRLSHDAAIRELLGAINYIAGVVIHMEHNRK